MDEMNPLEKLLQSWTPRRPSPKIARRLFGPAAIPSSCPRPLRHQGAWNWLSPVAACALTMLVAVHSANRAPAPVQSGTNGMFMAALMLNAASSSNFATYSASQGDENLEWNIWTHLTHRVPVLPRAEAPPRRDAWTPAPTNW